MSNRINMLNPYIAGAALGKDRGFFGRKDIFREVQHMLDSPTERAIVLYGQRRIGKTSILLQLEKRLRKEGYLPIYFDLMDKAQYPLRRVLYELALEISRKLGVDAPDKKLFDDDGIYLREVYLPTIQESYLQKKLVLMFDEFDVLDTLAEDQLDPSAAAKSFFPYLRQWMPVARDTFFVFVVGRRPDDLSTDFLATFKAARSKRVSVLASEDATELLLTAERDKSLEFLPEAIEAILDLTSGHPFLTQLFCQVLWNEAWDEDPQVTPRITVEDVISAIPVALELGNNQLQWIWDGLPPAERVVMAAIAQAEERTVTRDDLVTLLQESGIRIIVRELEVAPKTLVSWELLRPTNSGYTFFVELLHRWVSEYYPLSLVKDEIDRVDPLADRLYETGRMFYLHADLDNGKDQLTRALAINPNHFKARLLLGQIFQEQGFLELAIQEYRRAYAYDADGTRFSLVRALLSKGEILEQQGSDEEALLLYREVIELSPNDRVAAERVTAIHVRQEAARAKELESQEHWSEALQIYQQLVQQQPTVTQWSDEVERMTDALLEADAVQAQEHEVKEEWARALEIYHRLLEVQPKRTRWSEAISRVNNAITQSKARVAADYEQSGQWEEALSLYKELAQSSPTQQIWSEEAARIESIIVDLKTEQAGKKVSEGLWEEALLIYENLAAEYPSDERWPQAIDSLTRGWIDSQESRASELMRSSQWSEAVKVYDWLTKQQPDRLEQWQEAIRLAEDETALALRFDEGLHALKQQQWKEAQRAFADVINQRPDYRRSQTAAERLYAAIRGELSTAILFDYCVERLSVITSENVNQVQEISRLKWSDIRSLSFSNSCDKLVAATGRTVRVWDMQSGQVAAVFKGHAAQVNSVAFNTDDFLVASAGGDGTVRLWNTSNGEQVAEFEGPKEFSSVAFGSDGASIAAASGDGSVKLWNIKTGNLIAEYRAKKSLSKKVSSVLGAPRKILYTTFSPNGEELAILAKSFVSSFVEIWSTKSAKKLRIINDAGYDCRCIAYSSDGRWLTNGIHIWDAKSAQTIASTGMSHVSSLSISPDDRLIVTNGYVFAIKDGSHKVIGRNKVHVTKWVRDGESEYHNLQGHLEAVEYVTFSRDGKLIASAGNDGTLRLWGIHKV